MSIEYSFFSEIQLIVSYVKLLNTTITTSAFSSIGGNITIKDSTNSAIISLYDHIYFQGYNIFQNNSANLGGALYLYTTYVQLLPYTTLLFVDNHADYVGGAIYSSELMEKDSCFYNITSPSQSETVKMVFINNTASYGGSSLYYGDNIYQCSTYDQVINVTNTEEDPSAVAGDTYDVCFCGQNKYQPNCSDDNRKLTIYSPCLPRTGFHHSSCHGYFLHKRGCPWSCP